MESKIYALYDEEDKILGSYTRKELARMLNKNPKTFDSILCKLRKDKNRKLLYEGKFYSVYVYEEK